jgi:preflagellin peptidase FlaK
LRHPGSDVLASAPDLLRLFALPVLAWAAWRDVETRRVPGRTWLPLAVLALVLLFWDGAHAFAVGGFEWTLFAVGAGISLLVVVPAAYLFWRFGAFGGADAKALIVLALLFPTVPAYHVAGAVLPLQTTPTGAFALTILTNTVLIGVVYPLWLAARNALAGRLTPAMVVARPVRWEDVPTTHGRLLEDRSGFTRSGLDLDALRMYLRWRGATLAALRDDPDYHRRPDSLPDEPRPAGDGAVIRGEPAEGDGSRSSGLRSDGGRDRSDERRDDWGASAFLEDVGSAYGTSPEELREGLELLTTRDRVWVSPGIPFLVPILLGLVVALTYGDLLIGAFAALGPV